jgi:pilus assembly protein TadC
MEFKIPFTFAPLPRLKQRANLFKRFVKPKENTKLEKYLKRSDVDITREEYISIVVSTVVVLLKLSKPFLLSFIIAFLFGMFVVFSRMIYPMIFDLRRQKNIERNLIPALQDMHVQLSSGITLFSILVNISSSEYGELSKEFKEIVRRINAGYSQMDVLEEIGDKNSSLYFRRALWQISNGMRAGGDISIVIEESIKALSEEQLIQIQNYGNKLNPAIMFYMLVSVIIPALSITFLTVISSLIDLPELIVTFLFLGLFVFVMLVQIMFLGVIKSIRPSLLS